MAGGEFKEKIGDIKAETFNQLTDTIKSQAKEIRRLEALLSGVKPGDAAQFEKQMEVATMEISSLIAHHNKQGYVQFKWGAAVCQMTPKEARDHAFSILSMAELAELDALFYRFALDLAKGDEQKAMPLLIGFREFREEEAKK